MVRIALKRAGRMMGIRFEETAEEDEGEDLRRWQRKMRDKI